MTETLILMNNQEAINFIFAGKAIIRVVNVETQNQFTFKIVKRKKEVKTLKGKNLYYVSVLCTDGKFKFLGGLRKEDGYYISVKTQLSSKDLKSKTAFWYFNTILGFGKNPIPEIIHTYHLGYCGKCGKLMTDQKSLKIGYGKDCLNNLPEETKQMSLQLFNTIATLVPLSYYGNTTALFAVRV